MFDAELLPMTTILAIILTLCVWGGYHALQIKGSCLGNSLFFLSCYVGGVCWIYSVFGWLGVLAKTIGLLYFSIIILSLIICSAVVAVIRLHKAGKIKWGGLENNKVKYLRIAIVLVLIPCLAFGIDRFLLSHEVEGLHTVCYVTDTGECYHSSNCSYLYSRNKTNVYRAKKRGYRDCSRCSIGELDVSTKHEPFGSLAISSAVIGVSVFIIKAKRRK